MVAGRVVVLFLFELPAAVAVVVAVLPILEVLLCRSTLSANFFITS